MQQQFDLVRADTLYLALATLGFGEIMRHVFFNWEAVTRGIDGISGIPAPSLGPWAIKSDHSFFYLLAGTLLLAMTVSYRLERSKFGRAFMAIRDSDLAAACSGIDVTRGKVLAFTISAAMAGAGLAFLWFNTHPAQVFMGDVGALALGGALGTIAVITRQEIVLGIMGGVFVVEALSVMVQVSWFKFTKKRFGTGRRIFKMAPLHHHFEKSGWKETQVVVRFWIITMLLCLVGLASLKLR